MSVARAGSACVLMPTCPDKPGDRGGDVSFLVAVHGGAQVLVIPDSSADGPFPG